MEDLFEMNEYRFRDKKTKSKMVIYARELKTATNIIDVVNQLGIYNFVPKKIFFKKKVIVNAQPYVVEQEQLSTVTEWLNKAKEVFNATRPS